MSKNLFQRFSTETSNPSPLMNTYLALADGTEGRSSLAAIYNGYLLGEFDGIVDGVGTAYKAYSSIEAALTAGAKSIKITANIVAPTSALTITQDTTIYVASGVSIANFFAGFIVNGCVLNLLGAGAGSISSPNSEISFAAAGAAFFTGTGAVYTRGVFYKNFGLANRPLNSCLAHIDNCIIETTPGTANTGINLTVSGSTIINSTIKCNGQGAAGGNAYQIGSGCYGESTTFAIASNLTSTFATISAGGEQNKLSLVSLIGAGATIITQVDGLLRGGVACDINTSNQITAGDAATVAFNTINTGTALTVAPGFVDFSGAGALAFDNSFNLPASTTNTASGTLMLANYGGGTWTDSGAGTQGFMNSGTITNTSASISASDITSGTLNDARLSANVTLQGNAFNGASELVQMTAATKLPAVDGSLLTSMTKAQVGLSNVDNTSDANKPVSTATATAIGLCLQKSANLSDVGDAATARANLGLTSAATLNVLEYIVLAATVNTTIIGGVTQTFTVTGALTSDWVDAQIVGDGTALTLTPIAARVSATNTVELTLGTALALTVRVRIIRAA